MEFTYKKVSYEAWEVRRQIFDFFKRTARTYPWAIHNGIMIQCDIDRISLRLVKKHIAPYEIPSWVEWCIK